MEKKYTVRFTDKEAQEYLKEMSKNDMRTIGGQLAWLIHKEWNHRQSVKAVPVKEVAE